MTTKKAAKRKKSTALETPELFHRIDALLHTMRCIAQHEDQLCLLRHEVKTATGLSPELAEELRLLLEEMPSVEYIHDLHAVEAVLR